MIYENKNLAPTIETVPTVSLDAITAGRQPGIEAMLAHESSPVFKIEGTPEHEAVVHAVLTTARDGENGWSEWVREVPFATSGTPEHQDGLHTAPYIQVHTNSHEHDAPFNPNARVVFREYEFTPEVVAEIAQAEKDGKLGKQPRGQILQVNTSSLPASAQSSPVARQWEVTLKKGESLIFRNGFNQHAVSADGSPVKYLTHEFQSVDEQGNPTANQRLVEVSAVNLVRRQERARKAQGKVASWLAKHL